MSVALIARAQLNRCSSFLAFITGLGIAGCSNTGDYYRVDHLLDHASSIDGAKACRLKVKSATNDGQEEERRASECDELIPPLDLKQFRIGTERSAYEEALACERQQSSNELTAANVAAIKRLFDPVLTDVASISKSLMELPTDPSLAVTPTIPSVKESGITTTKGIEALINAAVAEVTEKEGKVAVRHFLTPAMLESAKRDAKEFGKLVDHTVEKAQDVVAAIPKDAAGSTKTEFNKQLQLLSTVRSTFGTFENKLDRARDALPTTEEQCKRLRDDLQQALITRSEAICERHKGQIHAMATNTNMGFGILTTLLAGAGAVMTGGGAQLASAGAAASNSVRSQVNEQLYQQQYVGAITRAIESSRQRKFSEISERRKKPLADYRINDAIMDAQNFHFRCSFYSGMQELTDAIVERQAKNPMLVEARIKEIDTWVNALNTEVPRPDARIDALKSERFRLMLTK